MVGEVKMQLKKCGTPKRKNDKAIASDSTEMLCVKKNTFR
jgi:hypothetical protein